MKDTLSDMNGTGTKTVYCYYHLYRSEELEQDISAAGGTAIHRL